MLTNFLISQPTTNGEMGVPITFLDNHNPEQFEILAYPTEGNIEYTSYRPRKIIYGRDKGKLANFQRMFLYPI